MTRALTGRRPVSPAADDDFEINTYFLPDILKKYKPRIACTSYDKYKQKNWLIISIFNSDISMDNYTFIIKHSTLNISLDHEKQENKNRTKKQQKEKKNRIFLFFFLQIIKKDTDKKGFFIPL